MADDDAPKLTPAELAMAKAFNMSAEEYSAYRTSEGATEWARAMADRDERERIRQAVRDALAERDGEAA